MKTQTSLASTAILLSLAYVPFLLSILSVHPQPFVTHPVLQFLLCLAPWWLAYRSARWYIRLAEQSSPLYHPLGCLTQCGVWVFHWVVALYRACFIGTYTWWTYLITIFCPGIAFITEGLFHGIITIGFSNTANLGVYGKVRELYGKGLVFFFELWYRVDTRTLRQQDWNRVHRPLQSRSMTM